MNTEIGALLTLIGWLAGAILAIVWIILPFTLVGRLDKIIKRLEAQNATLDLIQHGQNKQLRGSEFGQ